MTRGRDRELGMDRAITRRDFLNGVALGVGGRARSSPREAFGLPASTTPARRAPATTRRRSPACAAATPARSRSPTRCATAIFWDRRARPTTPARPTTSWSWAPASAAWRRRYFFRKAAGPDARILILDNHDDFGGHAKRNEFTGRRPHLHRLRRHQSPSTARRRTARTAKGFIAELGIDVARLANGRSTAGSTLARPGPAVFFDRETFGADRLVPRPRSARRRRAADGAGAFLAEAPLSDAARRDLERLHRPKRRLPARPDARRRRRRAWRA